MNLIEKLNPAVDKRLLLLLAGLMWAAVGIMLLVFASIWLHPEPIIVDFIFVFLGILTGIAVQRFGFNKIVDKNLERILPMTKKHCVFAFVPWKSYLVIVLMVAMGRLLRLSPIPKSYLAIVYITMGLAMFVSSFRYFAVFWRLSQADESK